MVNERSLPEWIRFHPTDLKSFADFWCGQFRYTYDAPVFLNAHTTIKDESKYLRQHALDVLDAALAGQLFYNNIPFWDYVLQATYDIEMEHCIDQHDLIMSCLLTIEAIQNYRNCVLPVECFCIDDLTDRFFNGRLMLYTTAATRSLFYHYNIAFLSILE